MSGHTGTDDDAPTNSLLTNPGRKLQACPVEPETNDGTMFFLDNGGSESSSRSSINTAAAVFAGFAGAMFVALLLLGESLEICWGSGLAALAFQFARPQEEELELLEIVTKSGNIDLAPCEEAEFIV